jgi:hypothetical protein
LFFPLVWVGLILLLDPFLYAKDDRLRSLLRMAQQGNYSVAARFSLAGMICGVLWEFWNYWAGSKWFYSIPFFDQWKVFEMPLLGYFGFPFFALECLVVYQFCRLVREKLRTFALVLLIAAAIAGSAAAIHGIDSWTVVTYRVIMAR